MPPRDREAEAARKEQRYTLAEVDQALRDILDEEQDAHQREVNRLRMELFAAVSDRWQPRGAGAAFAFIGRPVMSKQERQAEAAWRGRVLAELEAVRRG